MKTSLHPAGFELGPPCGACTTPTRRLFMKGKGNKAKRQAPKWWVCERGHRVYRKASQ